MNLHAVEKQALSLMDRQLDHLENYPEVAEMLSLHPETVRRHLARGELPGVKIGNGVSSSWRIRADWLDKWAEENMYDPRGRQRKWTR